MPLAKPSSSTSRYESDDSEDTDNEEAPISVRATYNSRTAVGPSSRTIAAGEIEIKIHECMPCNVRFATRKELKNHKIKDTERHQYCAECDRDFETHSDLQIHLIKSPLHIICVDCFKEFKSVGGLEGHRKQV